MNSTRPFAFLALVVFLGLLCRFANASGYSEQVQQNELYLQRQQLQQQQYEQQRLLQKQQLQKFDQNMEAQRQQQTQQIQSYQRSLEQQQQLLQSQPGQKR